MRSHLETLRSLYRLVGRYREDSKLAQKIEIPILNRIREYSLIIDRLVNLSVEIEDTFPENDSAITINETLFEIIKDLNEITNGKHE